jgi:hypothetical protein
MNKLFVTVIIALLIGYFVGVKYPSYGSAALAKVGA